MLRKLLCLVVVATASLISAAAADSALTLRLGTPDLSARVLITVPVIVSCSPFDPSLTLFSESVNVSVVQASGTRIATGSGSLMSFLPPLPFVCDDTEHTVAVNVLANATGPPFHGGSAVFTASAGVAAGVSCGPNCFFNIVGQSGQIGPTTLNMH